MPLVSPYDTDQTQLQSKQRFDKKNCGLNCRSIINFKVTTESKGLTQTYPSQNSQHFSIALEGSNKAKRKREKKIPVESADSYKSHTAGRSQMTV